MQSISKVKRELINSNDYWFQQKYSDNIPNQYRGTYYNILDYLMPYTKELINAIIKSSKKVITFPMETDLIQNYLTGYEINYHGFDNLLLRLPYSDGFRSWRDDRKTIDIFYNINCPIVRQRNTRTHETIHICQSLDPEFKDFLDLAILKSNLPKKIIRKLLEKITDKATVMYLMPEKYFIEKWQELKDVAKIADYFQVSEQSAAYRIKELHLSH